MELNSLNSLVFKYSVQFSQSNGKISLYYEVILVSDVQKTLPAERNFVLLHFTAILNKLFLELEFLKPSENFARLNFTLRRHHYTKQGHFERKDQRFFQETLKTK